MNPFDLLEETYKIYPAGVVECGREVSVSRIALPGKLSSIQYRVHIRIELTNRETVQYCQAYSDIQIQCTPEECIGPILHRDLEWMLRKLEAEINAKTDRTNKEPWT
ncbi:hypothetical protein D3C81_182560 [compost metagenome]